MQRSNIIFKLLISEKTIEGRVCCVCHIMFAGCSETPGAPRDSPLFTAKAELGWRVDEPAPVCRIISVSVFSHSQNEHFDLLYRTRRAPIYECDTDSVCGRTTQTHRDVDPHPISVFLSQTGLFLEMSEEHLRVEEGADGFGHFQQPQQDENKLNKSKLGLITLHLVTAVTNSN